MRMTLRIKGMHCPDCAVMVEEALRAAKGTVMAKVSYLKKKADVEVEDGTPFEALAKAVEGAGYGAARV